MAETMELGVLEAVSPPSKTPSEDRRSIVSGLPETKLRSVK